MIRCFRATLALAAFGFGTFIPSQAIPTYSLPVPADGNATCDVTVNLTSGTGEFRLRVTTDPFLKPVFPLSSFPSLPSFL